MIFAGVTRLTPNASSAFTVNSLTFNNTAGAFVFGGAATLSIGAGGITNNDTQTMTFNNPVSLTAPETINAASGDLVFSNSLITGANAITFAGGGDLTISIPAGTGAWTRLGSGNTLLNTSGVAGFNMALSLGGTGTTTLPAFGGTHIFTSTGSLTVGNNAAINMNENVRFDGGALTVNSLTSSGLSIAAGKTLTLNTGTATFANNYNFTTGGTIATTSSISTITAPNFTIGGGSAVNMAGGAVLTIASQLKVGDATGSGAFSLDGFNVTDSTATVLAIGTAAGSGIVTLSNTAQFSIISTLNIGDAALGTGTLTVQSGADLSLQNGLAMNGNAATAATFTVTGAGSTFTQTGGAGANIGTTGGGAAAIHVNSGGLFIAGSGTFNIGPTGSINVASGQYNANAQHIFSGGAQLNVTGTGSIAFPSPGPFTIQSGSDASFVGAVALSGARTINVSGPGSTLTASALSTSGGATVNVTDGATVTTGAGTSSIQSGGTINVTDATLIFGGPFLRLGGVLNFNSGTLTIDPFRTLKIDGGRFGTGALVNNGILDFQRGTLAITGGGGFNIGTGALGSNVTLGAGSTLQVTNTATIASGATLTLNGGAFASGPLANTGTLRANLGTASVSTVTNTNAGRIFVGDTLTASGAWTNAAGSQLTLENSGLVNGTGAITNSGLVTGSGTIANPFTNASGGEVRGEFGKTLYFTGATSANAGRLNLLGGTLSFAQQFTNSATGQINGQGALYFPATPVPSLASPNAGLMNAGNINLSGGDSQIYGTVQMQAGSRLIVSGGATASFFDVFRHSGTEVRASAGSNIVFFGEVRGAGNFTGTGTTYFEGGYSPGNSPALVTFGGNVVYGTFNTVFMEVGGTTLGTQYDAIDVAGKLTFDGGLNVSLINAFVPSLGNAFNLFDWGTTAGTFTSVSVPALNAGLAWDQTTLHTDGTLRIGLDTAFVSRTWDGGGANNNWITDANWTLDVQPLNNATADLIFTGIVRLAPSVDTAWNVRSITFNNAAGAFTITGPQSVTIGSGGIVNNDADTQTITAAITLSANETFSAAAGDLSISAVALAAHTLTLTGANDIVLATASGTGTIDKNNAGRLDITGALGTGGVTLNANTGTTNIGASETLAALNIGNGATVTLGAIPPSPAPEFGDGGEFLGASAQPVPEPGISALLASALALLGVRRSRSK